MSSIQDVTKELVQLVPELAMILGYGSQVVPQSDGVSVNSLVDLMIVTYNRDAVIDQLRGRGWIPYTSALFSQCVTAEVLFFADIPLGGLRLKLGIVDARNFLHQLQSWDQSLYLPGRLQKPVRILHMSDSMCAEFPVAQAHNLQSALAAGMLLIPEQQRGQGFDDLALFESIVGISYIGDIRMGIAENPRKITNIVLPQHPLLRSIYTPHYPYAGILSGEGHLRCMKSDSELFSLLPKPFRRSCTPHADPRAAFIQTVRAINRRESTYQAFVGLGTTGLSKSVQYLFRKVGKRFL
jgi:hypothetical protein